MLAAFDRGVYTTHWFWQDGRGNTSHITGDNAYLLERYTYDLSGAPKFYDEWGNERWGGSVYDTRFLFAGSQYQPETEIGRASCRKECRSREAAWCDKSR